MVTIIIMEHHWIIEIWSIITIAITTSTSTSSTSSTTGFVRITVAIIA